MDFRGKGSRGKAPRFLSHCVSMQLAFHDKKEEKKTFSYELDVHFRRVKKKCRGPSECEAAVKMAGVQPITSGYCTFKIKGCILFGRLKKIF